MPRDGSGVASPPPGTVATPNTTILSSAHNALRADTYQILNTAWPVALGGTGGTSPETTRAALGLTPLYAAFSGATATVGAAFGFAEGTNNGVNRVLLKAADALSADRTIVLPDRSGTVALEGNTAGRLDVCRNRIVNGDMRVSQENGTTSGTTNGYYGADQWATYFVKSTGVVTTQKNPASSTLGGQRYRVTITSPDTSLAAGEFLTISTNLEGSNVADFQYGSGSRNSSVLRFMIKGPAGTYAIALHNSAGNRSYVAPFTISVADADLLRVREFAIPGDATGTWFTGDGQIGITIDIVLAAGTTFRGVEGWQAGNILATSAISNGMAVAGAVFEIMDVGIRLDPGATGVYGQYEVGEVDAKFRSERYFAKSYNADVLPGTPTLFGGIDIVVPVGGTGPMRVFVQYPVEMAKPPNMTSYDDVGNINVLFKGGGGKSAIASNIGTKGCWLGTTDATNASEMFFQYVARARLS